MNFHFLTKLADAYSCLTALHSRCDVLIWKIQLSLRRIIVYRDANYKKFKGQLKAGNKKITKNPPVAVDK